MIDKRLLVSLPRVPREETPRHARPAVPLVCPGLVGSNQARANEAHRWARVARGFLARHPGQRHEQALVDHAEGDLLLSEGKYSDALKPLQEALSIREKVLGAE